MTWARHYKRKRSAARPIIKRLERRETMKNRKTAHDKERIRKHDAKAEDVPAEDVSISPDKYFMLSDGTVIRSIKELAMMMDSMSDESFSFHVNDEKNDFASWIRDVFGKEELADSLVKMKCRKESQIALLKHSLHPSK